MIALPHATSSQHKAHRLLTLSIVVAGAVLHLAMCTTKNGACKDDSSTYEEHDELLFFGDE